jgi:hypothetical protein
VAGFLEDNTPRVFAVDFGRIDMADVVPQDAARSQLKAADAAVAAGDRTEAMALLSEAFRDLFYAQVGRSAFGSGTYSFGPTLAAQPRIGVKAMIRGLAPGRQNDRRSIDAISEKLDHRVDELTRTAAAVQKGMRAVALGIDYGQYMRFEQLTPAVRGRDEYRQVRAGPGYDPTEDEYRDCQQFVITAALRLAELEARNVAPSWQPGPSLLP